MEALLKHWLQTTGVLLQVLTMLGLLPLPSAPDPHRDCGDNAHTSVTLGGYRPLITGCLTALCVPWYAGCPPSCLARACCCWMGSSGCLTGMMKSG
jgi:hypothetical protein